MGLRLRLFAALLLAAFVPVAWLSYRAGPVIERMQARSAEAVRARAASAADDWFRSAGRELSLDAGRFAGRLGPADPPPFDRVDGPRQLRRLERLLERISLEAAEADFEDWRIERIAIDPSFREELDVLLPDGTRARAERVDLVGDVNWSWDDSGELIAARLALDWPEAGGSARISVGRRYDAAEVARRLSAMASVPVSLEPRLPGRRYDEKETIEVGGMEKYAFAVVRVDATEPGRRETAALRADLTRTLIGAVAVSALLAGVLAAVLTRPVRRLAAAVSRVSGGEPPSGTMPVGPGEIGQLAAAVDAMLASLAAEHERRLRAERRGAWRDVARRVAHEVRNPLSPIRLAVDNVRRARARDAAVLDEALDVELSAIETEVARLDRLVGEFSEFARMPQLRRAPMKLAEVVETAIRGQVTEPARVEVRIEPGGGLDDTILGDRDMLGQAIANLARNAVEALGGEAGTIRARARREEGSAGAASVVLEIEDDGPGVDDSIGDTLFEPYVSGRGGSGLGLAIVRRVITEHCGTIAVVSPPDGGTRFVITLPAGGRPSREGRCREY